MKSSQITVFAVGCHPDDIEFMMGGTLFLLQEAGADIHYMNAANGNCGSMEYNREETAAIRKKEAQHAAEELNASWYPPITNDLEVLYDLTLIKKLASLVRKISPDIMLVPAVHDYMEDHMNTARIAITAAFTMGMPNFEPDPPAAPVQKDIALYHALPYGLHDGLNNRIYPQMITDITSTIDKKEHMLACHQSQRNWLDESQTIDSYLQTMRDMSRQVGSDSGIFPFGEGWIRHNPLGYSHPSFSPLERILPKELWMYT